MKLTKKQINQIKRLRTKGERYHVIAEKTGINYQTVLYHAKKVDNEKEVQKKVVAKIKKQITKDVTPKKIAPPIPNNVTMVELQEHMTGYLDGLAIRHNMHRDEIDRIMFKLLNVPFSFRMFG